MHRSKVTLKIILLGDQGVGKTCLLRRYVENRFNIREKATIGADFRSRQVRVRGRSVTCQVWDTAGLERFDTVNKAYYRGADHCIIVYDVTLVSSFSHIADWKRKFLENCAQDFEDSSFTLVGNKADAPTLDVLVNETEATEEVQRLLDAGASRFHVSAKTGEGVRALFRHVSERALEKYTRDTSFEVELDDVLSDDELEIEYDGGGSSAVVLPQRHSSSTSNSADSCCAID